MKFATIIALALALASCQSPPPNPVVEETKASVYEAVGEMIVSEIRAEFPQGPHPVPQERPSPPSKAVAGDSVPDYLPTRLNARNR